MHVGTSPRTAHRTLMPNYDGANRSFIPALSILCRRLPPLLAPEPSG